MPVIGAHAGLRPSWMRCWGGRYAEGERYCTRASEVRRQQLDPDQLELEDFLRSGDIAPSGAVGTPPSAADTGARDALAGSTDSLPSPRVEAIQGAMHAGDRNQRPDFQAGHTPSHPKQASPGHDASGALVC